MDQDRFAEAHTKQIFVTGGVVSSLGKGLTASSLGNLLRARGLRVVIQKLDPYINVDPGTMNPFQHGEVFVTADGGETDLDIGHYERFLDVELNSAANATTGQVYQRVIARERAGEYLGDTVQVIPHITDEIIARMRQQAGEDVDVIITEIGGTVGDIESQPFLEAARQLRRRLGRHNAMFIHVSLVPFLEAPQELKTKPTQHSVAQLRSIGIQPDAIVCRSSRSIPGPMLDKIANMCDVESEGVIQCPDASSIYEIPVELNGQKLDEFVVEKLQLDAGEVDWTRWDDLLDRVRHPRGEVTVAVVGKYIDLPDAYLSVTEAIRAGGFAHHVKTNIRWVAADDCVTPEGAVHALKEVDAVVVPGGFGIRGIDGKVGALRHTRTNGIPTLGICLGMQAMVIEAARNLLGWKDATSTEFDENTSRPVIATMEEQKDILAQGDLGGSMRLGAYPAKLREGSAVAKAYGSLNATERHRHRYEMNGSYREELGRAGLVVSGTSPDGTLAEYVEFAGHPYYVGTQAHPEFTSRPTNANPLFAGLIAAALK